MVLVVVLVFCELLAEEELTCVMSCGTLLVSSSSLLLIPSHYYYSHPGILDSSLVVPSMRVILWKKTSHVFSFFDLYGLFSCIGIACVGFWRMNEHGYVYIDWMHM